MLCQKTDCEEIRKLELLVDSKFRNPRMYPNPFAFPVKFGGEGIVDIRFKSTREIQENIDNYKRTKFIQETVTGDSAVKVNRHLKNVKFIRVCSVILPKSNIIKKTATGYEIIKNSRSRFENSRYITLRIKGIGMKDLYVIDSHFSNDSFLLYPDRSMNDDHRIWLPLNVGYTADRDTFNLSDITVELLDEHGNIIEPILIDGDAECPFDIYKELLGLQCNESASAKEITGLIEIYQQIQIAILFSIGIDR